MLKSAMRVMRSWTCALGVGLWHACTGSTQEPESAHSRPLSPRTDASSPDAQRADVGPPPVAAEPRVVLAGHVENARDLGGIALSGGDRARPGVLFRGPPLANLLQAGCAAFASLGIRTVVDLRIDSEVALQPEDACVLEEAQLVAAPLPVPYNVSPQDYIADLDARESIARVFEVLGDEQRYPVYFHCTWGRDRTGVLAAVVLLALGADAEAIMRDYLVSLDTVGAYPMSLMAALDEIQRRGGVEAYLRAAGVTDRQLSVLRERAIEHAR